jgi:alanine-glyoxylate transaminase/serine-glyoxylate transaminase/serine-pyruvate transaminase
MLEEEGPTNVFARHHRLAEATRRAVRVWRQNDGRRSSRSIPAPNGSDHRGAGAGGYDADKIRQAALDKFNVSLGGGLDRLKGRVFASAISAI